MFASSSQISFAAEGLSIQTFMKEIRPVVTEKRVFVSGDESKVMAQFGIYRTITIQISRFKQQKKTSS